MNVRELSSKYYVRKMTAADIDMIYDLSTGNPLFYQYCPPYVTKESIMRDMEALPPNTTLENKFYIGFFDKNRLIALMDLITNYPDDVTAFIGLFMMNQSQQGKGLGSVMIKECSDYLRIQGYHAIRLGFAKGNPQSEAFWKKNGFVRTGSQVDNGGYIVVGMEKKL